jgi:undecaprenyl-diphosphatase
MEFLIGFDKGMSFWLDHQIVPRFGPWGLDATMLFFTHLGDQLELWVVVIISVLALWLRRRIIPGALILVAFLAAHGISERTKILVQRPRPDPVHSPFTVKPQSYSFPSGHALESTAVYITLALVAIPRRSRPKVRNWLVGGASILVFLIGFSRVYLGVHFVTDVIGGWAAGWAIALTCAWLVERWEPIVPRKDIPLES